jgi:hypothetical protein
LAAVFTKKYWIILSEIQSVNGIIRSKDVIEIKPAHKKSQPSGWLFHALWPKTIKPEGAWGLLIKKQG